MPTRRPISRIALWIVQGVLAALFLFAGGGAVIVTAITQGLAAACFPLGVGVLATTVAVGRRSPSPRTA